MNIPVLTFRGAYDPTQSYGLGAMVTYNGSTYISLTSPNAGNTPSSSPSSWQPVSTEPTSTTVSSSGATQTLAIGPGDNIVDVTLSANCTFAFTGTAGIPGRLTLIIRPAGFTASLPASSGSIVWAGGSAPVPSTSAVTVVQLIYSGTAPIFGGI